MYMQVFWTPKDSDWPEAQDEPSGHSGLVLSKTNSSEASLTEWFSLGVCWLPTCNLIFARAGFINVISVIWCSVPRRCMRDLCYKHTQRTDEDTEAQKYHYTEKFTFETRENASETWIFFTYHVWVCAYVCTQVCACMYVNVCVCVCAVCIYGYSCFCMCWYKYVSMHAHACGGQIWRIISRSFFYHINWQRVSQSHPELIDTASLTSIFQGFSASAFWDLNCKWSTIPRWQLTWVLGAWILVL